jgi:hypothetical protein
MSQLTHLELASVMPHGEGMTVLAKAIPQLLDLQTLAPLGGAFDEELYRVLADDAAALPRGLRVQVLLSGMKFSARLLARIAGLNAVAGRDMFLGEDMSNGPHPDADLFDIAIKAMGLSHLLD